MFLPEQVRTTSFRVALIFTLFFVASVLAILGTTYLAASSEMAGILRSSISDDMEGLRDAYRRGGDGELQVRMTELAESASEDRFFLMRQVSGEEAVIGNIPATVWREGWAYEKLSD